MISIHGNYTEYYITTEMTSFSSDLTQNVANLLNELVNNRKKTNLEGSETNNHLDMMLFNFEKQFLSNNICIDNLADILTVAENYITKNSVENKQRLIGNIDTIISLAFSELDELYEKAFKNKGMLMTSETISTDYEYELLIQQYDNVRKSLVQVLTSNINDMNNFDYNKNDVVEIKNQDQNQNDVVEIKNQGQNQNKNQNQNRNKGRIGNRNRAINRNKKYKEYTHNCTNNNAIIRSIRRDIVFDVSVIALISIAFLVFAFYTFLQPIIDVTTHLRKVGAFGL